ncbi:MAG TPA: glycosyltransferase [Chitinivibrionales bacterium]|nr:glycosyltransferase [Chitinivibrionales bacterium]
MIFTVITTLLACYTVFVAVLLASLMKSSNAPSSGMNGPAGVSIIIPFRNEARHLPSLLASLAGQEYSGQWEVLLVNDGSSDNYRDAAAAFQGDFPARLRIIDSVFDKSLHLTSKQQALDKGVNEARFEWCVFSDADMSFDKDWLASWAAQAIPGADFIFGHTTVTGRGPFAWAQRFQLAFLFAAAYSFHKAGIAGSCMGNNLLIRKKAYVALGGQAKIGYSIVEDRDLYRAFKRHGYSVESAVPFSAKASTLPCATFGQFYFQMIRWARGGFSFTSALLPAGLLLTVQNFAFLTALFGLLPFSSSIVCIANFLLTMFYLQSAFKKMNSLESAFLFPVYYPVMLFETVVLLFSFFITPKAEWKGRKL